MYNFCTLFDSNYLTRGLALYASLRQTGEAFTLYIFCFDNLTKQILEKLALPHVILITLDEFETVDLLRVKESRSGAEYCWTCTSQVIRYSLDTFALDQITYLDADLYFFQKPSLLLDEFNSTGASVLITEHRYAPRYDQALKAGIYCVQFITFNADERGRRVLQWWQERCLEWCYARYEEGKFGDQKYLDDWTSRFDGVHVLQHLGGGVAPWNIERYDLQNTALGLSVNGIPLVFYHYHQYKIYSDGIHDLGDYYRLPREAVDLIYRPYLQTLCEGRRQVAAIDSDPQALGYSKRVISLKFVFFNMVRRIKGTFNVYQSL